MAQTVMPITIVAKTVTAICLEFIFVRHPKFRAFYSSLEMPRKYHRARNVDVTGNSRAARRFLWGRL